MPLADRYAHWQQRADDPILDYVPLELLQDVEPVEAPEPAVLTDLTEDAAIRRWQLVREAWEGRAWAITAKNAARRAEEDV